MDENWKVGHKHNYRERRLTDSIKQHRIHILGITETKKAGYGNMKITNHYTLYYSGVQNGTRPKEG